MPRIRTIKPEFWTDETVVELDFHERLLFIGLWNFCDDQGFIDYKPKQLKMRIFPGDTVDVVRAMEALVSASLVRVFTDETAVVCQISNWAKHQRVTNPAKPRFSPSDLRELPCLPETLARTREESRVLSGERKGREGIKEGIKEGIGGTQVIHPSTSSVTREGASNDE